MVEEVRQMLPDVKTKGARTDTPNTIRKCVVQAFDLLDMLKRENRQWPRWIASDHTSVVEANDILLVVEVDAAELRLSATTKGKPEVVGLIDWKLIGM